MHNLSKKQNRKCWKRKSIRVFLNILFEENRSLKSITKALDLIKNHGTQFAQKKCQNFLQNDTDNTREFWTVVVDLVAIQFKQCKKFAKYSDKIYSFDIDSKKLLNLCHNAYIYKVLDKI